MPKTIISEEILDLKKRRENLLNELSIVDKQIFNLTDLYEKSWSIRAIECIKKWNEYITTIDILGCMYYKREYLLREPTERRKATVGLSVALNKLCKAGIVQKIEVDGFKGNFYGLTDWKHESAELYNERISKLKRKTYGRLEAETA